MSNRFVKWRIKWGSDGVVEDFELFATDGMPVEPRMLEDADLRRLDLLMRSVTQDFGIVHPVELYRRVIEDEMKRRGIVQIMPAAERRLSDLIERLIDGGPARDTDALHRSNQCRWCWSLLHEGHKDNCAYEAAVKQVEKRRGMDD
jgi:hypothetical protein